jgi:hypothetical protein
MDEIDVGGWDSGGWSETVGDLAKTYLSYQYALKSQAVQSGIDATKKVVDGKTTKDGQRSDAVLSGNTGVLLVAGGVLLLVLVLVLRK